MPENNKRTKVKKVLPAVVLATSFYYSYLLALGIIVGYIGCRLFYKKLVETGKVDLIFIDCGKWKIHVHHWIMGAIFLTIVWVIDWFYLPSFFAGTVLGIIAHDIYDFNDWHRIILSKDEFEQFAV